MEEQLESLKAILSKYMQKLKSSKHKKEYLGILRTAMNKLDKEGISLSYKVDQYISQHDLITLMRD